MTTTFQAADLFCGAGGTSTGLLLAARELGMDVRLFAVNHWQTAIVTHQLNHPGVQHLWADIEALNPREVVPGGKLRLLVASPECIFFSSARGGKPINDQRRSSASYVLDWARQLDIEELLIENVKEFERWGPIYPDDYPVKKLRLRPIPERAGEHFQQFVADLRALGYTVHWRVLCAADYGDATSRQRLFIRASKRGFVRWPLPTHSRSQWRPAREIIDWNMPGKSIYGRSKPLCPATMKRIMAGLEKFSGLAPYLVEYHGDHSGTSSGDRRTRSIDEPLATADTSNRFALAQPALVVFRNHADALPVDKPLPAICAEGQHLGLMQPYLSKLYGGHDACSVDEPLPTVTANFQHYGLVQPFLINQKGKSTAATISLPLPTQTAHALHLAVPSPFLTKYYATGTAQSIDAPLDTITTVDRFGLVHPQVGMGEHLLRALNDPDELYRPRMVELEGVTYLIDILYRMLYPGELGAAMSFPKNYAFTGTQADQVKQVGNSVPVELAKQLCLSILAGAR